MCPSYQETEHGDPVCGLDHLIVAIRNFHDSGNTTSMRRALAVLASPLNRLGRHEAAATIAGYPFGPLITAFMPEFDTLITDLRDALGDHTYESLGDEGETMTAAAMVTYAFDQIDQTRAELNAISAG